MRVPANTRLSRPISSTSKCRRNDFASGLDAGNARSGYQGFEKTHLQNILTAAAINLTRAINWLTDQPLAEGFATLAA